MNFVAHGWGVVAGAVWDGARYTQGYSGTPAPGLVPMLPDGPTIRDARKVWAWWSLAPYAVLARAGEDFDVITVPTWFTALVTATEEFRELPWPVISSLESARFLVRPGARLPFRVDGVEVLPAGVPVPLPPTRTRMGPVTWWVRPEAASWRLGDPDRVTDLLYQVIGGSYR